MSRLTPLRGTCVVGLKIGNSMEGPLLVLALVLLAVAPSPSLALAGSHTHADVC